jgi:hypothetical protein
VPTRIIRRTKAEPQPCAAAWFRDRDSNPNKQLQGLSSCRLDDPGSCGRGTRSESRWDRTSDLRGFNPPLCRLS